MAVREDRAVVRESRWPPALAVLLFTGLNIALRLWLPADSAVHVPWLAPAVEVVMIVVLLTSDPSNRAERVRLRRVALGLAGVFVAAGPWAAGRGVPDLDREDKSLDYRPT